MDLGIGQNESLTTLQAILSFFFFSLCSYHFFLQGVLCFPCLLFKFCVLCSAQTTPSPWSFLWSPKNLLSPLNPAMISMFLTLPLACLVLQRCMDRSFSGLDYPWGHKSYFIPLLQMLGGVRLVNMTVYAHTSIGSFLALSVQVGQLCQTSHWSLDFRRRWFSTFLLNAPP